MAGIFTYDDKKACPVGSIYTTDRLYLLDKDVADDFNTYRTWSTVNIEATELYLDEDKAKNKITKTDVPFPTRKSLFNNVFGVNAESTFQTINNAPLLDGPAVRAEIHRRGLCTVKELCRASEAGEMGREIFNYGDFMYCKHLGKVSNNYLVTLRRFPYPCGDNISFWNTDDDTEKSIQQHLPDIGRLVTWMGVSGNKLSEIMNFKVWMPWEELKAGIEEGETGGDDGGMLGTLFNMGNPKYLSQVVSGRAGDKALGMVGGLTGGVFGSSMGVTSHGRDYMTMDKWHDQNKTWGNADVITKTHKRQDQDKGGLEFNQEIKLTFDYQLRAYDGINGRAAMLDLLANILAVTYTEGSFWGGVRIANGASQSNAFANLPLFKLAEQGALDFSKGSTYKAIQDAGLESINSLGKSLSGNSNFNIKSWADVKQALKGLGNGIMNTLLGGALNALGRPKKQAINSLLTDAPVGPWHLTIGNPKHPIMSMGNMIISQAPEIQFYGPLGLDDMPTGLKVTITLKHGKPRDSGEIQRMFFRGDYRIYQPYDGRIRDVYEESAPISKKFASDKKILKAEDRGAIENRDKLSKDELEKQEQILAQKISRNHVFMKYFGTDSFHNITWAAKEANHGSIKTEKSANSQEIENQNKKNSPIIETVPYNKTGKV